MTLGRKQAIKKSIPNKSGTNAVHWLVGLGILAVLSAGIHQAVHSSLFVLKNATVEPFTVDYPMTPEKILDMARVPIGRASLFDLNLVPIEARLMKNPWVKGVIVGKQFPNTLSLKIIERVPVALLTEKNGRVLYLEQDGTTFEDQGMVYPKDLPILVGFSAEKIDVLRKLNSFIHTWFSTENLPKVKLSSIHFDEKLGLRAVVSYPMKNHQQMRSVLELGLNVEEASLIPGKHLQQVLSYLSDHSMSASKIWLGDGKKIVVKVSRGS